MKERFIKPTSEQLVKFAIVVSDGDLEPQQLANMLTMSQIIIDRLYENGNILTPSSKEEII